MPGAPRVHRRVDRRMMRAEGAFSELQLAQQNSTGLPQAGDDSGVTIRAIVFVDGHAGSRRNTLGMTKVLYRNWNAVQRSAKRATGNIAVGLPRLGQRQLWGGLDIAFEPWIEAADAVQHR